jgi:hypothetical protein
VIIKPVIVNLPPAPDYYVCPDPKIVASNENKTLWSDQDLIWSIDETRWGMGSSLNFMQALIQDRDNSLFCYYKWPNPNINQPGTWLWMTIRLNPNANQVIHAYGDHWVSMKEQNQTGLLCESALPQTCAFKITTSS